MTVKFSCMFFIHVCLLYYCLLLFYSAYEKAAREQRMRTEISQARREVNAYLDNVNKGKVHAAIEERKKKKRKADDNESVSIPLFTLFDFEVCRTKLAKYLINDLIQLNNRDRI